MFGACSTQHIATLTAPLKSIQAPEKNVAVKDAGKKTIIVILQLQACTFWWSPHSLFVWFLSVKLINQVSEWITRPGKLTPQFANWKMAHRNS
jgi:hypothetical protein